MFKIGKKKLISVVKNIKYDYFTIIMDEVAEIN